MKTRRGFLQAMLAAGVAPAFVAPTSLMPLWLPRQTPLAPKSALLTGRKLGKTSLFMPDELTAFDDMSSEFIDMLRGKTMITPGWQLARNGTPFRLIIGK